MTRIHSIWPTRHTRIRPRLNWNKLVRLTLLIPILLSGAGAALAGEARPGQPANLPPAQQAPAPAALSQSKFLGLLYSEIAKLTPEDNPAGPGEVRASFIVNAKGKVDKVTIDQTSSSAHAEIVKKILASVQTPPPPGGAMDVGQTFKFH